MEKIFIVGGSGLLGANWASVKQTTSQVTCSKNLTRIPLKGIETREINFNSILSIREAFIDIEPSVVVNAAGLTNVELCEYDHDMAHSTNVMIAKNTATVCCELGISFVHISTDHLFDGLNSYYDETESPKPLNAYAHTKMLAEKKVQEIYPESLIIRTNFFCWGLGGRASFSDVIYNNLIQRIPVDLFEDVFFNPVLVDTLIDAVDDLVKLGRCGVYNVTSNSRLSKYEFGCELATIFGLELKLIRPVLFQNRQDLVKRPLDMSLSNRKVSCDLNRNFGSIKDELSKLYNQKRFNSLELE